MRPVIGYRSNEYKPRSSCEGPPAGLVVRVFESFLSEWLVGGIRAGDHYEIARQTSPSLSPDGSRVAFIRRIPRDEESIEATVYVTPISPNHETR